MTVNNRSPLCIPSMAVWLLCCMAHAAPAQAQLKEPEPDHYAGVHVPTRLGPFTRQSFRDYTQTDPDMGVSFAYGALGHTATVYVFNGGQSSIPDGPGGSVVRAYFEGGIKDIHGAVQAGVYSSATIKGRYQRSRGGEADFLCAEAELVKDSEPHPSILCITGMGNQLVKTRVTGSPEATAAGLSTERINDALLDALLDASRKGN